MKKFCTLNNCKDSIEYDICDYTGIDIKTINSNINELLIDDYIIEMENKTYGFNV